MEKMEKIIIALLLVVSWGVEAQTYYCPLSSSEGVTKKSSQWFVVQDSAVITKSLDAGKEESVTYKKMMSANPSVVYFNDGVTTSSLTIVHSAGSMKGTKYSDVVSFKKDLKAEEPVGLWYCTVEPSSGNP